MNDNFSRDHVNLLHSAGIAADCLEQRCTFCAYDTVTLSRDELAEIADQFQRVVSLLTAVHIARVSRPAQRPAA